MNWRKKLVFFREGKRFSQADLGRKIGLPQQSVGRWEAGKGAPSMEQGLKLARALEISYDYFADDTLDEPPAPALNEDETFMLRVLRGAGISPDELVKLVSNRALLGVPVVEIDPPRRHDVGILAARDESASVNRPASYPKKVETRTEVKKEK